MSVSQLKVQPAARETLELVSFLLHETRSQLNSIITSVSLLAENLSINADDPKTKLLSDISSTAYDIEAQLTRIIDLAKPETSGFQLDQESLDLRSTIYAATERLLPNIRSKNQTLTTNLEPGLPSIRADSVRLEQVLLDLLSNACNNTRLRGHISLSANQKGNFVAIEIQYGGPAIPPERQRHMFQPFNEPKHRRGDATRDKDLSLALCKYFVELHGGRIQLRSEENKGNIFYILLPIEL